MQDEEIIGFDALYASMNLCAKNVRRKANVGRFLMYGMDEILKLQEDLENGTYKARPTSTVKITYPKPRTAVATSFRDRVYQRSQAHAAKGNSDTLLARMDEYVKMLLEGIP